jgi:DNA-binding NtrC family response regulator
MRPRTDLEKDGTLVRRMLGLREGDTAVGLPPPETPAEGSSRFAETGAAPIARGTSPEDCRLIGRSTVHHQVLDTLDRVAPTDVEILIRGPTGVGTEPYADYLHRRSSRAECAFVSVNCGGLPAERIENELFGHVGGAFTGARPASSGLIAAAEGGTLFLDEIDLLSLACQVKLLRFLQDKEYRRIGETHLRCANIRIVAATNADLVATVRNKTFREDLLFRLGFVSIDVPALAQRREDIPLLLDEFVKRFSDAYKLPPVVLSGRALKQLKSYSWPGNIRELESFVEYLTCLRLTRPIDPSDLPLPGKGAMPEENLSTALLVNSSPLKAVKRDLVIRSERSYLKNALRFFGGNITGAARVSSKLHVFLGLMRKH